MNKKAFLILIPLFTMLSLLAMPAFAITVYPSIQASGWAYIRTCEGCVSGCATLYVVLGLTDGVKPTIPSDFFESNYVMLCVHGHEFEWVIDSVKCKCNVLTICASPAVIPDVASDGRVLTPLSSITVVINLCKPYCVTAFGCGTLFAGQGHPLALG